MLDNLTVRNPEPLPPPQDVCPLLPHEELRAGGTWGTMYLQLDQARILLVRERANPSPEDPRPYRPPTIRVEWCRGEGHTYRTAEGMAHSWAFAEELAHTLHATAVWDLEGAVGALCDRWKVRLLWAVKVAA